MIDIKLSRPRIEKSRERVEAVWNLEEPDRVPFTCEIGAEAEAPPRPDCLTLAPPCVRNKSTRMPPINYFTRDPEDMLRVQLRNIETHLMFPNDDYIPALDPAFGVSVVPSAFGCQILYPDSFRDLKRDPIVEPILRKAADVENLVRPDPYTDGLMPRVLQTIDYWKQQVGGKIPVALTDSEGVLGDALMMRGTAGLILDMYREPGLVHKLMNLLTETLIEWFLVQKDHAGQELDEGYCWGTWIPKGKGGAFMGDDGAAYLSPHLYEKFVAPYDSKVLGRFKGGLIHWCGDATQNYKNFLRIPHCTGFHVDAMGHLDALAELKKISDKHVITCGDSPLDIENYWKDAIRLCAIHGGFIARDFSASFTKCGTARKGGYTSIVRKSQLEIAQCLTKVFSKYGKYPLR